MIVGKKLLITEISAKKGKDFEKKIWRNFVVDLKE